MNLAINVMLNNKPFDFISCTPKIQYALEEQIGIYFTQVLAKVGEVPVKYNPDYIQLSATLFSM